MAAVTHREPAACAHLEVAVDVFDECRRLVERDVSATTIEEQDLSAVVRARDAVGPSDGAGVHAAGAAVLQRLEALQ